MQAGRRSRRIELRLPTLVNLIHLVESAALLAAPVVAVVFVVSSVLLLLVDTDAMTTPSPSPAPSPSPRPGGATVVRLPVPTVEGKPALDTGTHPRAA